MTQAILNPVKLPSDLNPAEKKFARCLGEGNPCTVGSGELPAPDNRVESGDAANVVRAEVIRFFAHGGDDEHPVRGTVIDLRGAQISGGLDLTHANIPYALLFGHCHFADSVRMQHAECVALNLVGSHLAKGLEADGLTAKGGMYLRNGFFAESEVLLLGASIGGVLDCKGGKFHDPKGYALTADGLTTKGGVYLRDGFSAEGEVRLLGADIGGQLACEGGKFHNPNPNGFALIAEHARIGGSLLWRKIKGGKGVVNLSSAKAGVLADDTDSWKPFKVISDGFTYDQIVGPTDAESRIEWLAKRPDWKLFSPRPYEQAAKVLFGMGHAHDAREVLLEKERLQTADERTPLLRKIGRTLWDVFAGYGYRLRRTAAWMAGFVFLGAFIFWFADQSGCIVPNRPVVLANAKYNEAMSRVDRQSKCPDVADRPTSVARRLFPDYPEFNAFVYSLDVFIPVFALHQEPNWHPRPCPDRDLTLRFLSWWHWLEIGAGWILTSLFLLSVTGVLRPRQSSGEKG